MHANTKTAKAGEMSSNELIQEASRLQEIVGRIMGVVKGRD
jgi:hypothetical protein